MKQGLSYHFSKKRAGFVMLFIGHCFFAYSQTTDKMKEHSILIAAANFTVSVDGLLNDSVWQLATPLRNFRRQFPDDTSYARAQTTVYVYSDDKALYIAATCTDTSRKPYIVESLKRDFLFASNDNFSVIVDPYKTNQNGYVFSVTPFGVQREGQVINSGSSSNDIWDQAWRAAVQRNADGWTLEMAIPFSILRVKKGTDVWGINFVRNNVKSNEVSSWVPVPINQPYTRLGFTGTLQWIAAPQFPKPSLAFIPYTAVNIHKNHFTNEQTSASFDAGLDVKVPVFKSLNLDLTLNPDFSQVEVDRQIINLDRFDVLFPEQRQFFIENSDFFHYFGFSRIRPFFSRRIGLYNNQIIPLIAGARLSGNINADWRMGLMTLQTKSTGVLASQNYTVAALQRRVSNHSVFGAIAVNRQGKDYDKIAGNNYNRVLGVEYNLRTLNGRWSAEAFVNYNFSAVNKKGSFAGAIFGRREARKLSVETNLELVGNRYNPEVGYVPRKGINRLNTIVIYRIFPKSKNINQHTIHITSDIFHSFQSFQKLDNGFTVRYNIIFKNTAILSGGNERYFTRLTIPFDATGSGNVPLPDAVYQYRRWNLYYTSNYRKPFWINLQAGTGPYFNGKRTQLLAAVNKRFLPYGSVAVNAEYNDISFEKQAVQAKLWLIGSKIDLTFSKKLFFTSFLQYNTQTKNFNSNTRL